LGSKRYESPPIIEAICEFKFTREENTSWGSAFLDRLYGQLGGQEGEFSSKESIKNFEVEVAAGPEGVTQRIEEREGERFSTPDGKLFVRVSPHVLAIHHLAPYTSWGRFLPKIQRGYQAYCEVASPMALERIGLRYINRVTLQRPARLEQFFEIRPHVGKDLPQDFFSFIVGVQIGYDNGRDIMKLQLANAPAEADTLVVILDLDYFLAAPAEIGIEEAVDWVDQIAHDRVEEVFEASITQKLRQRLGEIKSDG